MYYNGVDGAAFCDELPYRRKSPLGRFADVGVNLVNYILFSLKI